MTLLESLRILSRYLKRKLMNPEVRIVLHQTILSELRWRLEPTGPDWYQEGEDDFMDRLFSPDFIAQDEDRKITLSDYVCGDGLSCTGYCLTIRNQSNGRLMSRHYNRLGLRELHRLVKRKALR